MILQEFTGRKKNRIMGSMEENRETTGRTEATERKQKGVKVETA